MGNREAEIELTLSRLMLGDSLLKLSAMMATFSVQETRRQSAEGQCFARIVRILDAEGANRAIEPLETVTLNRPKSPYESTRPPAETSGIAS